MRFYSFILLCNLLSIVGIDGVKDLKMASWLVQDNSEITCSSNCPTDNRGSGR